MYGRICKFVNLKWIDSNNNDNYDDDDDDDDDDNNNNNNNNPQVSYYHIFILLKTEMKLLNMVIFHINRPFNDNIPTIFE